LPERFSAEKMHDQFLNATGIMENLQKEAELISDMAEMFKELDE
jgi:hypothetical protein